MTYCCVPLCKNSHRNKQGFPELKFHRFPTNEVECRKWVKRIRRKDFIWTMNSVICSWSFPKGEGVWTDKVWNVEKNFQLDGLTDSDNNKSKRLQTTLVGTSSDLVASNSSSESEEKLILETKITSLETRVTEQLQTISSLRQDAEAAAQRITDLSVEIDILRYENKKLREINTMSKITANENQEMRNKILNQEHELRSLRFELLNPVHFTHDMATWDAKSLSSFSGFQSISSIQFLIEVN